MGLVSLLVAVGFVVGQEYKLLMYGGAWKGPHAEKNVGDAVALGYRSFDTANVYAASYNETAMGVALEKARASGVKREELFIQTKFSPDIANDHCEDGEWDPQSCMWDKNADLATQAKQSVQTSLVHLRIDQIDSLVLHWIVEPWSKTEAIWRSMEELQKDGKVKHIGVSHAHTPEDFQRLLNFATIKPAFVQNPIVASNRWDQDIRRLCKEHGVEFQAYALNHVENDFVYQDARVLTIAKRLDRTPQQVIVAFAKRIGLIPLVGPQDAIKMAYALTAARYLPDLLTEEDLDVIENIAFEGPRTHKRARAPNRDGQVVEFSITNNLPWSIHFAWQHPDHTHERTAHGMHASPSLLDPGATERHTSRHRHGFYIWDSKEGKTAPLYREGADKRWVRRIRVDGYRAHNDNDVVVDEAINVVVQNLGPHAATVFFVEQDGSLTPQGDDEGVVEGGGGSLSIGTFEGHSFEIRDASGGVRRVTIRRSDGDPQLLAIQPAELVRNSDHDEL